MTKDPWSARSAKLLAALDFSEEAAALEARRREEEARHREELAGLLRSLLDVMDSFDRLLAGGDIADPTETIRRLARQLNGCLERAGVVPLPCLGETADPEVHEIAEARPAEGIGRDTIVEVVSGGYLWNGRLLRRPRVVVAAGEKETRE